MIREAYQTNPSIPAPHQKDLFSELPTEVHLLVLAHFPKISLMNAVKEMSSLGKVNKQLHELVKSQVWKMVLVQWQIPCQQPIFSPLNELKLYVKIYKEEQRQAQLNKVEGIFAYFSRLIGPSAFENLPVMPIPQYYTGPIAWFIKGIQLKSKMLKGIDGHAKPFVVVRYRDRSSGEEFFNHMLIQQKNTQTSHLPNTEATEKLSEPWQLTIFPKEKENRTFQVTRTGSLDEATLDYLYRLIKGYPCGQIEVVPRQVHSQPFFAFKESLLKKTPEGQSLIEFA